MSLTDNGFDRPRLLDLKAKYDELFTDALGPVNTDPDAVVGQMIGIFAAAVDDLYEVLQDTYDSMYPYSATGTSLDGAVSYIGMQRIGAAPTTVVAACYGAESTLIPAGSRARSIDGRQYIAIADEIITRASIIDALITVVDVIEGANYQIIAAGNSYNYTAPTGATAETIAAGLAEEIGAGVVVATSSTDTVRLLASDKSTPFQLTVGSKMAISKIGSPVSFQAIEPGAHGLPVGALVNIDSSISGWNEVYNLAAGAKGRDVETDAELRARHLDGQRVSGAATAAAIKARLSQEVDGVSYVTIYENRSGSTDVFGLPPHSFETVVQGGSDADVAVKLFELKPAGIETYGNTTIMVNDSNGDGQACRFSRPYPVYAWVKVTVTGLYSEEQLPDGIVSAIKNAVIAQAGTIGVGEDIIVQRFYGPIYAATTGIGSMTIEVAVTATAGGTPTYGTANIGVARAELAEFDLDRITVLGVS